METKANHLMIGSFVLALIACIFGFLVWLARIEVNREFDFYTIYFRDSVAGLGVGGDVRFSGIKVGSVAGIDFDRNDPSQVQVTVQLTAGTPVSEEAYAILQPQGLTGLNFVQIVGRGTGAKMLQTTTRPPYPVIPARPSTLGQLSEQAPELLAKGIQLLERATDVINPDNQRALAKILADIAVLTDSMAKAGPEIERVMRNADATATEMRRFSERLGRLGDELEATMRTARSTMQSADRIVANDVPDVLREARGAAKSIGQAADEAQRMLADNQVAVSDFTGEGLAQFGRFITESRLLVQTLQRLAERIENDPAQFIFGGRAPEREAK